MIEQAPDFQDGGRGRVFQPQSELEMCIYFSQGTARGREVVEIFPTCQAAVALGDICGNGYGGLSNLGGEAIPLLARESTGQVIASHSEVDRRLPDAKVSVVASALHGHSPRRYREHGTFRAPIVGIKRTQPVSFHVRST